MTLSVEIKKLVHFGDLKLPEYETVLAAGADLRAAGRGTCTIDTASRR
jgi:dUTPase